MYTYEETKYGKVAYGVIKNGAQSRRNQSAQKAAGHDERHSNDHGGHLIPDSQGGRNDESNLVAQNANVNQIDVRAVERRNSKLADDPNNTVYTKVSTYTQPGYERPDAFMITSAVRNETTGQIDVQHNSFTNASHAEQEQWSQLAVEYSEVDPRQDVGLSAEERALANQYADVEVDESLGTGVTYFVKDTPKEKKADMMSMTNNATLSQLQSFLGSAQAALPQAQAEIQNIKSQITACQQKVSSLATQIQNKQMTIDGYRTQVNQEERMIHALQQEYSSLIDQAATAQSEEELRAIQERVKTIRAQAEQHQAKAEQYKAQMQKAEQEKAQMVQEQNAWKAKLQQWKSHLTAFQGKCRQTATHIGRYGTVARSESVKLNRQGTAFAQGADGRFRTEMRNAAQWRSSDAQAANNLANQLDNVARGFRALASSSESDHEREIER